MFPIQQQSNAYYAYPGNDKQRIIDYALSHKYFNGRIDWSRVHEITHRSAHTCAIIWHLYNKSNLKNTKLKKVNAPKFKLPPGKKSWSLEEDRILLDFVAKNRPLKHWKEALPLLPGRSAHACCSRLEYLKISKPKNDIQEVEKPDFLPQMMAPLKVWNEEDDAFLINYCHQHTVITLYGEERIDWSQLDQKSLPYPVATYPLRWHTTLKFIYFANKEKVLHESKRFSVLGVVRDDNCQTHVEPSSLVQQVEALFSDDFFINSFI